MHYKTELYPETHVRSISSTSSSKSRHLSEMFKGTDFNWVPGIFDNCNSKDLPLDYGLSEF